MRRLKAPQRREQLIEVATKLFAKFGYEATTTFKIAEAAGVTEPILYRHFETKQEMFVAIVRSVSEQTMASWREIIDGETDPAQQIRRIAEAVPGHIKQLADAYHVLHGALATSRDKKVLAVMKEHYAQYEDFFTRIIERGQAMGVFRPQLDPKGLAWQLIMTGIGYAMITLNLQPIEQNLIKGSIESILRGMSVIKV
ncbi:MAG TPA: TetR/AcrR family transcriptional regulator [Tepidisphaeraceae bacterium]|nr:TetR/AcrR family transcriptional regulator [Tepidisphaeraceae bacterium]